MEFLSTGFEGAPGSRVTPRVKIHWQLNLSDAPTKTHPTDYYSRYYATILPGKKLIRTRPNEEANFSEYDCQRQVQADSTADFPASIALETRSNC